jgi:hydroxymethylbilane synthase
MAIPKRVSIGTRGSKLALAQTNLVADALRERHPELAIQIKVITTKGDVNQSPIPLDTVGKAWFTEEIEEALLRGEIDLAVHSLKDLPPQVSSGIAIILALKRADSREALISKSKVRFSDLPKGSVVGTDSARRKVLILEQRPDLSVRSIRGNVDTRIKKLMTEDYDAIMLAAAGLERIGMLDAATEILDPAVFIPAIGQGILAVQVKEGNDEVVAMARELEDTATVMAADAEQAFSRAIGGGCKLPIGCFARLEGDEMFIDAAVGNDTFTGTLRKSAQGKAAERSALAQKLAEDLLKEMDHA